MIITSTPLRISFVGGGSDMPSFFRNDRGAVLSVAIDKYVYVTVNKKFDDHIRVSYSRTEEVSSVEDVEHPLVRACMTFTGVTKGVEITSIADIPSRGTGLGSSSSFTVGLLNALYSYSGRNPTAPALGQEACKIEIDICGAPIGKQDQYAAAFGGMNIFEFSADDSVRVEPVTCARTTLTALQGSLMLLYTGITRSAAELLRVQIKSVEDDEARRSTMRNMVKLVDTFKSELYAGNIDALGEILHESWLLKRSLTSQISSEQIDNWYATARKHGAIGGKILGAGAGGFLLLLAPPDRHDAIKHSLPQLRPINFSFDRLGSRVIFNH